jgi:ATP-dependent protease HslVU (ClpYQ) peptidase subunit
MTCIVAVKHDQNIFMGGDRCLSDYESSFYMPTTDPKIFKKDNMIIGYAGSVRMGKVIKYDFEPPKSNTRDLDKYMNIDFISALRECLEKNNLKLDTSSPERNDMSELIIGIKGRIFIVEDDWQVTEYIHDYLAIGSGSPYALGSLYSTTDLPPNERVQKALEAADQFSITVCQPFDYIVL